MTTVFVSHPSDMLDLWFGPRALARLREFADVRLNRAPRTLSPLELVEAARGCEALIAYRQTEGPEALFGAWPELVAFIRCAMDIRTVDVDAASAQGVLVTRASAGFQTAVAEWAIGMMIGLGRHLVDGDRDCKAGRAPRPAMGRELRGATLGIVGYGAIGSRLAELALPFGMNILVTTLQPIDAGPRLRQVGLQELLAGSDYVVCLAPANAQTANMFDAAAFAAMKPAAFFINAARGELVDDAALRAALDSGRLAGCALDVGRAPDQMPAADLARHPRVIATPHIAGLTPPAIEHQALETVAQLRALLDGRIPPGAVNAEQATRLRRWGHAVQSQ
jgi:D-3-phosphoglycerate dehydrogenase